MATSSFSWNLDLRDFQSLLDRSTDLVCLIGEQGQVKAVGRSWLDRLGLHPEEISRSHLRDFIHLEDHEKLLIFLNQKIRGQAAANPEIRCLTRDREIRWLSWSATYLPEKEILFCLAQDVTESKKREQLSERADRLLKQTINSLPVLVAYMDPDFNYLFMNEVYEQWVGHLAESLKSGELERAVGPRSGRKLRQEREVVKRTGKPSRFEITFLNRQGEERFLEVQYHPHFNRQGHLEGIMVLAFDLTEIKRANEEIRKMQAKLQRVLNDGRIGFWEMDFRSGMISVSDNIRRRLGLETHGPFPREQLVGLIHPEDQKKLAEARKLLEDKRQSFENEFRLRNPRNGFDWVYVTGNPTYEDGKLIGMMGVSIDVSERKKMEHVLRLQQAQMMASSRLSAIGEMASGVAHEINNPLAIILSNAENLRMNASHGHINPRMVEGTTEKIESTVMRIAKIIRSLRSLSRDSERDPVEPVQLKKVIDDALEICNQRFKNNDIELRIEGQLEDIQLQARPSQLSQVMLNLLNNAFDSVEGLQERWVHISAQDHEDFVEITVTDSGPGIPAQIQEKIFDPFFTTKDPSRGTGLGLSVSRSLIQAHGGTLQINSQSSHTQFVIRLPKRLRGL